MSRSSILRAFLLAVAALAADPSSAATGARRFRQTPIFESWLGDAVLLDEKWLELPGSGLELGYFLKPKPGAAQTARQALEDAFFLVDSRTGAARAPGLRREAAPADGCPGPGEVADLHLEDDDGAPPSVSIRREPPAAQTCLVRVESAKGGARTLRFHPDPSRTVEQNFPAAVKALAGSPAFGKRDVKELEWRVLPGSDWWLIAGAGKACELWVVDGTSKVNVEASQALTKELCACAAGAQGYEPSGMAGTVSAADVTGDSLSVSWNGAGTEMPFCVCAIGPTAQAKCDTGTAGIGHYPTEEETVASTASVNAALLNEQMTRLRHLIQTDRDATQAWRAGDKPGGYRRWLSLYREYVEAGRPKGDDNISSDSAEGWEEVLGLMGQRADLRHAVSDTWIEILNNLGFALWSLGELKQAGVAYAECQALLDATGKTRDVLEMNRGDLERDLGHIAEARAHYEKFLQGKITPAQRTRALGELKKLGQRTPAKGP